MLRLFIIACRIALILVTILMVLPYVISMGLYGVFEGLTTLSKSFKTAWKDLTAIEN